MYIHKHVHHQTLHQTNSRNNNELEGLSHNLPKTISAELFCMVAIFKFRFRLPMYNSIVNDRKNIRVKTIAKVIWWSSVVYIYHKNISS